MKKKIEITGATARKLYKSASAEFKAVLEDTFGKEYFNQDLKEIINDFNDILEITGRPDVPAFADLPEDLRDHFQKYYKVIVITEGFQEKKMDIYDQNKYRYYPWYRTNGSPSGFAFYGSCCDNTGADAGSGSRLSFSDREISDHVGEKFIKEYREYLES